VNDSIYVHCPWCDREHTHGYDPAEGGVKPTHRDAHCCDGPFRESGYYIAPLRKKDVSHQQNAWARQQELTYQRLTEIKARSLTPAQHLTNA
jgi:hypothetical protein